MDHSARLVKRITPQDINAALPCAASDLNLFESGAHIDGEHRSVRLNLVNHGKAACRLGGYPSISLVRQDGSLIGNIAIEKVTATTLKAALHPKDAVPAPSVAAVPVAAGITAQPSPYVLLAPSGEATFEVGWMSGHSCDQVGAIAVAAPGTLQSFTVHHAITVCEGRIQVTAVSDGGQL